VWFVFAYLSLHEVVKPNGNLLTLNNIGTLNWHYNNTLNQLNKQDKNTTEYYVYDYQGSRVRTVMKVEVVACVVGVGLLVGF
jgi:hypothetical protein